MESRAIKRNQITASSFYSKDGVKLRARDGRLHNDKYWATAMNDLTHPWIQVNLSRITIVTGIITQGSAYDNTYDYMSYPYDEWVTNLQIQYGDSDDSLMYILEDGQHKVSTFTLFLTSLSFPWETQEVTNMFCCTGHSLNLHVSLY